MKNENHILAIYHSACSWVSKCWRFFFVKEKTMKKLGRVEVYSTKNYWTDRNTYKVAWYWRLKARNGKIIAIGGEGYSTKSNCWRAYRRQRYIQQHGLNDDCTFGGYNK